MSEPKKKMTKPVKQGADLKGKLCGVSDDSLEDAKFEAKELPSVYFIIAYLKGTKYPYDTCAGHWKYAYPVSDERIEQMKAGL